ncbi:MAG TPA: SDR family NAD(P)-dependent oxidoreductase [Planctomycetota bacterium]|nr:SDR family NAD(P)-dependent oxidoreductase [Planctomycetota bacterium]
METDFEAKDVVVTGAGGSLGAAVVRELLVRGARCHLPARSKIDPRAFGGANERVRAVDGVDLADEKAVESFYAALPSPLWASIHCAGGFAFTPIVETKLADFAAQWSINAVTAFLCTREAVKRMRGGSGAGVGGGSGGSGGRIVNVAARPALEPRQGAKMAAYTASKAAVAALTLALAEEVAGDGIWVNAVAPSVMDTPANRAAMPKADMAKWPTVDDVAATVVHLASPKNRVARGGVVPVYGRS